MKKKRGWLKEALSSDHALHLSKRRGRTADSQSLLSASHCPAASFVSISPRTDWMPEHKAGRLDCESGGADGTAKF